MHLRPFPIRNRLPVIVAPGMANPWLHRSASGRESEVTDGTSRREIVWNCMDAEKLRAYIAWPGTQMTVRKVAQKRLDALLRGYRTRRQTRLAPYL